MKAANGLYHYTGCGLTNIWLRNGFTIKETPYGETVTIHVLEGLHNAIGLQLVKNKPSLSPTEIRYLRKEMDFSQADLARLLGVGESTMRNWERSEAKHPIQKPAERMLRVMYFEYVCGKSEVRELVERISQINRDSYEARKKLEFEESEGEWNAAA